MNFVIETLIDLIDTNWVESHCRFFFKKTVSNNLFFMKILKIIVIKTFKNRNVRSYLCKIVIQTTYNTIFSKYK